MIYFIGAGPGATDLITVRGMRLLQKADVVIYVRSSTPNFWIIADPKRPFITARP